jgi:vitamin B12 transporter
VACSALRRRQRARLEAGALSSSTFAQFDASSGTFFDTPSAVERRVHQAWTRGMVEAFEGILTNSLQIYSNRTERIFREITYRTNLLPRNTGRFENVTNARYQEALDLGTTGRAVYAGLNTT